VEVARDTAASLVTAVVDVVDVDDVRSFLVTRSETDVQS
jgi:hypothetical protein